MFKQWKVLGLDPSPELVAISMVYFVQGILGLSRLAVQFFYKDTLHIDPAEVAVLTGIATIPWMIKPLYGFISDAVPLMGYRRRSYLVLCGLMGSAAWTLMATSVTDTKSAVVCLLLASLSTAASDVVVDSIVVERARGHPQAVAGSLQSLCWASAAVGGITSAYFSGSFVQEYGCKFVFGLTAFFPLVVSASSMLIAEQPVGPYAPLPGKQDALAPDSSPRAHYASSSIGQRLWAQGAALWAAVRQKGVFYPALFILVWQATPSSDSAMFFYQTNVLHFQPEFLGKVRLAASLASLAGVAIFNTWLKAIPLRRLLWWMMLLGTALSATQLILISGWHRQWGLSDQLFVLGDSVVLTVLGQVSVMPILVLAARMCPEGVEATLFATLMSIFNSGSIAGGAMGAALTKAFGVTSDNFDNLFALTALCVGLQLTPAPFLRLLPGQLDTEPPEDGPGAGGEGAERRAEGAFGGGQGVVMDGTGAVEMEAGLGRPGADWGHVHGHEHGKER